MPDDDLPAPDPTPTPRPMPLGGLAPDEPLARAMQTVKMTGGTAGVWQPPTVEECAQLFPGYEVLRLLGRGGMGAVYQARQIELDRLVAIKLLPLEISVDKDFADRFRREARAMAKLNHPNIVTVHDFGTTREGHLFFVMEYVEGANLAEIIRQVELEPDQSLSIAEQVCIALAYAHNKGIVHRDIKPANVMVDTESHVKVADFGLARLTDPGAEQLGHTMTGTVMGTPDYMAPEQGMGMSVDHRADIYSLGVMIYEMMCRQVPKGIFDPPSHRTGCDARIDAIVIKAMQQSPERRYQSTQEMRHDITGARTPLPAPPPATGGLPRKPRPIARSGAPAASPQGGPTGGRRSSPPPPPAAKMVPLQDSPVPPETMVMQAVKQPAPAPAKKSKLPLYAGIGVGVAALAVAAFLFLPKKEKLTKAQIYAREHAGGQLPNTPLANATKEAPFINSLGMKFVPVPGADILMCIHETRRKDYAAYAAAVPGVDGTWKQPVVNGKPLDQQDDHPVVMVSWDDAAAFCSWLSKMEGRTYRLPTEHEWNLAVVTGLDDPKSISPAELEKKLKGQWPWGTPDEKDAPKYANYLGKEDGYDGTAPVMSYLPNHLGIYDLGGNAWEWCDGWFASDHKQRVLRGGGFLNYDGSRRSSWRVATELDYRTMPDNDNDRRVPGFRLVVATGPVAVGGTRSGVSQTSLTAATPHLSPSSEPWVDAMKDNNHLMFKVSVKEGAALRMAAASKGLYLDIGPEIKDGAVRMLCTADASTIGNCAVQVRRISSSFYNLSMTPDFKEIGLGVVENSVGHLLKSSRLPVEAQRPAGQPVELELRVVGTTLVARVNGYEAIRFEDSKLGQGHLSMRLDPGVSLHAVQTLDLSKGAAAPLPASAYGWVSLLPLVDIKRDTVDGNWRLVNGVLNGDGSFARLVLPYVPPEEYDFRIRFTRQSGNLAVSQHLAGPKQDVMWIMGGWSNSASGLEQINGAKGNANATSIKSGFENGRRYESVVKVRRDRVQVELDGQPVVDYKTDWSDLSMNPKWSFPDPKKLGVGCQQPTVFHSIEVHPEGISQMAARPAATLTRSASYPQPSEWIDATNDVGRKLVDSKIAVLEGDWLRVVKSPCGIEFAGKREFHNAVVRLVSSGHAFVDLRKGDKTGYSADEGLNGSGAINYYDSVQNPTGHLKHADGIPRAKFDPDAEHEVVCAVQEDKVTVWLDGVEKCTMRESTLAAGMIGLHVNAVDADAGVVRIKKIEYAELPDSVTIAAVTKDKPFVNTLGMQFVPVPIIGGPTGGQRVLFSVWDTRVQDYEVFARETKREWPKPGFEQGPTHPAVMASWEDAQLFCRWLNQREQAAGRLPTGWSYRLPSDHEWSCAVGIGDREDPAKLPVEKQQKINDVFPWDKPWPPPDKAGNYASEELQPLQLAGKVSWVKEVLPGYRDGFAQTSPVGSFAANRFGLYDMGGNVWQWCEDWFEKDQKHRVLRGASWGNGDRQALLSSARTVSIPGSNYYGFRCVLAPASPALTAPSSAQARQTLDLLALVDPVKDRMKAEGFSGVNDWSRKDGRLVFKSGDGKSGKVVAPVSLNGLRDFEVEAEIAATTDSMITLDFPTSPTSQATVDFRVGGNVTLAADEHRKTQTLGVWPKDAGAGVIVAGRIQFDADGLNGTVTANVNGRAVGSWHGPLTKIDKSVEVHPDFPGQLLPALFTFRGDREYASWTLRVFQGEARVLRAPAGAR